MPPRRRTNRRGPVHQAHEDDSTRPARREHEPSGCRISPGRQPRPPMTSGARLAGERGAHGGSAAPWGSAAKPCRTFLAYRPTMVTWGSHRGRADSSPRKGPGSGFEIQRGAELKARRINGSDPTDEHGIEVRQLLRDCWPPKSLQVDQPKGHDQNEWVSRGCWNRTVRILPIARGFWPAAGVSTAAGSSHQAGQAPIHGIRRHRRPHFRFFQPPARQPGRWPSARLRMVQHCQDRGDDQGGQDTPERDRADKADSRAPTAPGLERRGNRFRRRPGTGRRRKNISRPLEKRQQPLNRQRRRK
jgi:hypothetical protein